MAGVDGTESFAEEGLEEASASPAGTTATSHKEESAGSDPVPVLKGTITTTSGIQRITRALAYLQMASVTLLDRQEPKQGWRSLTINRFESISRILIQMMTPKDMLSSKTIREPWKWLSKFMPGDQVPVGEALTGKNLRRGSLLLLHESLRENYRAACESTVTKSPDQALQSAYLLVMRAALPHCMMMTPKKRRTRLRALISAFDRIRDSMETLYPESDFAFSMQVLREKRTHRKEIQELRQKRRQTQPQKTSTANTSSFSGTTKSP